METTAIVCSKLIQEVAISASLHKVSPMVNIACVDRPGNATVSSDWLWKTYTTVQRWKPILQKPVSHDTSLVQLSLPRLRTTRTGHESLPRIPATSTTNFRGRYPVRRLKFAARTLVPFHTPRRGVMATSASVATDAFSRLPNELIDQIFSDFLPHQLLSFAMSSKYAMRSINGRMKHENKHYINWLSRSDRRITSPVHLWTRAFETLPKGLQRAMETTRGILPVLNVFCPISREMRDVYEETALALNFSFSMFELRNFRKRNISFSLFLSTDVEVVKLFTTTMSIDHANEPISEEEEEDCRTQLYPGTSIIQMVWCGLADVWQEHARRSARDGSMRWTEQCIEGYYKAFMRSGCLLYPQNMSHTKTCRCQPPDMRDVMWRSHDVQMGYGGQTELEDSHCHRSPWGALAYGWTQDARRCAKEGDESGATANIERAEWAAANESLPPPRSSEIMQLCWRSFIEKTKEDARSCAAKGYGLRTAKLVEEANKVAKKAGLPPLDWSKIWGMFVDRSKEDAQNCARKGYWLRTVEIIEEANKVASKADLPSLEWDEIMHKGARLQ